MNDQNSLHRELKEQEFSTISGSRGSRDEEKGRYRRRGSKVRDRDKYGIAAAVEEVEEERLQVVGVLGDEQMVSGGDAAARDVVLELRWHGGVVVARWSCGGAVELWWRGGVVVARRHAWPGHGGGRW